MCPIAIARWKKVQSHTLLNSLFIWFFFNSSLFQYQNNNNNKQKQNDIEDINKRPEKSQGDDAPSNSISSLFSTQFHT